jgi:CheY-like chemotaxis protein
MGCTASGRISDFSNTQGSVKSEQEKAYNNNATTNLTSASALMSASPADEARSFRSKVGAMKIMMRTSHSYESLLQFLQEKGRAEYLICYKDMNEIKILDDDQMISRTAALIWRYKTSYEAVRILGTPAETMEYLIWECFGKLRQLDIANAPAEVVKKYLVIAQNEIIARLVIPFEEYLNSPKYREWQDAQMELEKQRRTSRQASNVTSVSPKGTAAATGQQGGFISSPSLVSISIAPKGPGILGADYPDVLVVDDSLTTLKLTGLTLERDGHHVDRAANGQIALQLMKSQSYDVVLIDCNMPVMDGFEAVSLFREHERQVAQAGEHEFLFPASEDRLSSISGSEDEDEDIRTASKSNHDHSKNKNKNHELQYAAAASSSAAAAAAHSNSNQDVNNSSSKKSVLGALPGEQEQQLRRKLTEAHYHQLIIGMSTNIDEETRDRALAAGMDFFLPKPFTLEKFLDTLRRSRAQRHQQISVEQQLELQDGEFYMNKKQSTGIMRASMGEGTVQSAVMSTD